MATLIFLVSIWIVCKGVKALSKHRTIRRRPACQVKPKVDYMAALIALQEQRDIYNDLISDIDFQLDNAPRNREKLLKDKAIIYSKLAIVESKIAKLIN